MARGFMYLVAVMDWWSRYVLGWRLSNTLEAAFCVDAWEAALRAGRQAPLISNTVSVLLTPSSQPPGCSAKVWRADHTNRSQAPDPGATRSDSNGLPR
jgi:transposase InsO family protein